MSPSGANPQRENAFVATAIWGSADPLERSARDASWPKAAFDVRLICRVDCRSYNIIPGAFAKKMKILSALHSFFPRRSWQLHRGSAEMT
jgi:hypothetical protein